MDSSGSAKNKLGCFEQGKEPSAFIKCWDFFFSLTLKLSDLKSSPPRGVIRFVRQLVTCHTAEPNAVRVLTDWIRTVTAGD